jgi:hypothetical protein
MYDIPISAFKNARSTEPTQVALGAFLRSTKYKDTILAIRAETDKTRRDEMKKNLPAATISGTFDRREVAGLRMYNGLVCMDFDAKENQSHTPERMKEILSGIAEVAFAATSVGGQGVYAIVPTNNPNPQDHPTICGVLGELLARLGLTYDRSCKDICRLRFVSYDPAAYHNPTPATFDAIKCLQLIQQKKQATPDRRPRPITLRDAPVSRPDKTRDRVEAYLAAIEGSCCDITTDYEDWYRIGFAFAQEFGIEGETYFHRASQYNPKYDQAATAKKFAELLRNGRRVSIGTFFQICKNNGITI